MNALRTRSFPPAASLLLAIAVSLAAAGCAPITRFATLEGVIKDERLASGPEVQLVRIERGGGTKKTELGMALTKADRIVTAPDVSAVITFAGDWEVILEPGSELEILNPTVFVRAGVAIVLKLRAVREALKAQTTYTIAAPEGTLFRIEVRGEQVTYEVVEGQLLVSSRLEAWPPVVLGALDQGTVLGSAPPERARLEPGEAEEIRRETRRAGDILEPEVPELVGTALEEAKDLLAAAGLKTGMFGVRYEITGRSPVGTVIRQDPEAGVKLSVGEKVKLVVEAESVPVPDLVNPARSLESARSLLRESRLETGNVTEELVAGGQDGTVTNQSPAAGTLVAPATRIQLTVLRVGVEVPDLRNLDRAKAEARLNGLGLRWSASPVERLDERAGTVLDQSPAPGTLVQPRSEVTFSYAVGVVIR